MPAKNRAHDGPGGESLEQRREMTARQKREIAGGIDQLVVEARGHLARCILPEALAAGLRRGRSKALCSLDMRRRDTRQRYGIPGEQSWQRAEAGFEMLGKPAQFDALSAKGGPKSGETWRGARSQNCQFQSTGEIAEGSGSKPAGGKRMLQRGEQRHRGELAGSQIEDKPQKDSRRRSV